MKDKSVIDYVRVSFPERKEFYNFLNNSGYDDVLILSYPEESLSLSSFGEFFQSPFRVHRFTHAFSGLFAIDLSSYIEKEEKEKLESLFDYIEENEEIKFTLFVLRDKEDVLPFEKRMEKLFSRSSRTLISYVFECGEMKEKTSKKRGSFGY